MSGGNASVASGAELAEVWICDARNANAKERFCLLVLSECSGVSLHRHEPTGNLSKSCETALQLYSGVPWHTAAYSGMPSGMTSGMTARASS